MVCCARVGLWCCLLAQLPLFAQSKTNLDLPLEQVSEIEPISAKMAHRAEEETHREALRLYAQGIMHERSDRLLVAQELLEKAAKLDPSSIGPQRALASLYLTLNRPSEALVACQKVLAQDPDDFQIAFQAAKLLKQANNLPEAKKTLAAVIQTERIQSAPERLIVIFDELAGLSETLDLPEEQSQYLQRLDEVLTQRREAILLSAELRIEDIDQLHVGVLEKLAQIGGKLKQFDAAQQAMLRLKQFLDRRLDAGAKIEARRLSWNLCELCCAQEKWGEALKHLEDYLVQRPARMEPYQRKVELLHLLKRSEEVIPTVRKWVEDDPYHTGLELLLAKELGKQPTTRAEADQRFQQLATKQAKSELYLQWFRYHRETQQLPQTVAMMEQTLILVEDPAPKDLKAHYQAKDCLQAILQALAEDHVVLKAILVAAATELDTPAKPKRDPRFYTKMGSLALLAHSVAFAEKLYAAAVQQQQPDAIPLTTVAYWLETLRLQRKWAEIVQLGEQWLPQFDKAKPQEVISFRIQIAWAYTEMGKLQDALKTMDALIPLANGPDKVRVQCQRLQMLALSGQADSALTQATELLDRLVGSDANVARITLSHIYLQLHQYEKSEAILREMIAKDGNDALALNNFGYQMTERGVNLQEAEKHIRKAIEIDRLNQREGPLAYNPAYLDSLAWVQFKLGQTKIALENMRKVVEHPLGAIDPVAWEHLGDILYESGNVAEAQIAYQTALPMMQQDLKCKKEGRIDKLQSRLKK